MNKIYVIMCFTKLEQNPRTLFPNLGDEAIMGWYKDKQDAFDAVIENWADIDETLYDYVIIEEVPQGLYPASIVRWLFRWNIDKQIYEQIEEPKFLKGFCGLVM